MKEWVTVRLRHSRKGVFLFNRLISKHNFHLLDEIHEKFFLSELIPYTKKQLCTKFSDNSWSGSWNHPSIRSFGNLIFHLNTGSIPSNNLPGNLLVIEIWTKIQGVSGSISGKACNLYRVETQSSTSTAVANDLWWWYEINFKK